MSSLMSPAVSIKREGSRSLSPPRRSKVSQASPGPGVPHVDTVRWQRPKRSLWTPDDENRDFEHERVRSVHMANNTTAQRGRQANPPPGSPWHRHPLPDAGSDPSASMYEPVSGDIANVMIRQPETRPISQEQLAAEVKGIYAGLVMVESKCIEVDSAQKAQLASVKLNKQLQALVAFQRMTLQGKHDYLQTSHTPTAAATLLRTTATLIGHGAYIRPPAYVRHNVLQTRTTQLSDFSSGQKQYFVEGYLDSTPLEAFPDSGADMCLISPDTASNLGLVVTPGTARNIQLANNKPVQSPGMVRVPWTFSGESTTHMLECWVLRSPSRPWKEVS